MNLFDPIAHQLERFAQSFLERALQFLVNRGAHFFDLLRVVLLQLLETQIHHRAQALESRFIRFRQFARLA